MSENTPEEWRPVVGYEGLYEVSDLGRVRSLDRHNSRGVWLSGKLKSTPDGGHGYLVAQLWKAGQSNTARVHRLVLESFKGSPAGDKDKGLHNNGNPQDNRLVNLRWGSSAENEQDKKAHGMNPNSNKANCKNGHPFSGDNVRFDKRTGHRRCRTCSAESKGKQRAKGLVPGDPRHGTENGYTSWGCRCGQCREFMVGLRMEKKTQTKENN